MKKTARILMVAIILLAMGSGSALAALWSSTSASLLYGTKNQAIVFNPDTGMLEGQDQDRTIITLEHADGWTYGDNFFFFDISQPFANDSFIYGEWHPRLSLGKITNSNAGFGFVKDTLIATEINVDVNWRAYLYGIGFDLEIPAFNFFAINFFIRDEPQQDGSTWQISPSWSVPFHFGNWRFTFDGFVDFSGSEGTGKSQIVTQPQLLLDISNFAGSPGKFLAGVEYQIWKNKYGLDDINENYIQIMGKWVF